MSNNESEKRQLEAQISRKKALIESLEERVAENPKDASAKMELRRQERELQGLYDELNS